MIAGVVAIALLAPQSPAPRLTALQPAGGTIGTEVRLALRGERLAEPVALQLDGLGIEVLAVEAGANDRCAATLRIAGDCPLGPHSVRLRSKAGLSNVVTFHIGPLPSVAEQREGAGPQPVSLGTTIDGSLRDGDVDSYCVEVPAGVAVHVEVEAMRLGMTALDTALAVHGADGTLLASADDTPLGGRDPWLAFTSPVGGPCLIELRGAVPGEGREGAYRLHIGTFPRPYGAQPNGGQPGEALDVTLLGCRDEPAGAARAHVVLPDDGSELLAWYPQLASGTSPTPVWLRVGGPPNRPPQPDDKGQQWLEVPGAVHGVVTDASAPVRFHWRGKKGEEVEFRVLARVLRSALDPVLTVRGTDGRSLASNDDGNGFDSVLRFAPPADGEFVIEVRDLLRGASPQHGFRLEAGPRERAQRLAMQVAREVAPIVVVPQGGSGALVLQRTGLELAQRIAIENLPPGVVMTMGPSLDAGTLPVLFTASAEAPLEGAQLRIGIVSADGAVDARWFRQVQSLLTGRNDIPLVQVTQRTLPLVVVAPAPFSITATTPLVPVVRGASLTVPLQLVRPAGFEGRVRVRAAWMPPGLSAGQATIDRGAVDGALPIEAAANAPLGEFPCLLVATSRVGGTVHEIALPFVVVRTEEPWAELARAQARTQQGKAVEVRLAVTSKRPRTGPATALLGGLPRGASCAESTLAVDATELVFPVQVATDAAVGRHRNLTVELRLPDEQGRPVQHRFAAGELRIDTYKPPKVAAAPVTAPAGDVR